MWIEEGPQRRTLTTRRSYVCQDQAQLDAIGRDVAMSFTIRLESLRDLVEIYDREVTMPGSGGGPGRPRSTGRVVEGATVRLRVRGEWGFD